MYTGQDLTANVKVTYNGKELEEGADYTVSDNTETNAGTHTLTVTGNGNGNGNGNSSGTGSGNTTGTGTGSTSATGLSGATGGYNSPKTLDAGLTLYAASAALSGAGLTVLRRRKR